MSGIPDTHKDLLESTALMNVASLGPSGEPQVTPVWFGWDGEHLRFSITKARQKFRNLSRDGRVAVSIVDPQNPYRYLEVRGTVVRIEDDPTGAYIDEMAKKYLGQDKYPWAQPGDERKIVVIEPLRTSQMG
ncbi:MAG: PPOX class F420-dependent oxidoreductase [Thermomicrobiales bacterium]|nr:PPOX class F420-dependent oxidoreductase [Thermomicrobiales bacterium]